ncbi:hypothetical protein ACLOAV_010391 [Pseudogymnoascus australis]
MPTSLRRGSQAFPSYLNPSFAYSLLLYLHNSQLNIFLKPVFEADILYPHDRLQNVGQRHHRLESPSQQWFCANVHAIWGHGPFDDNGDLVHGPFDDDLDHCYDGDVRHFDGNSSGRNFEHEFGHDYHG